ncbi:MAG: hypothetical protein B6D46_08220 [Polyangiaceae bacterium UTPRO1]|jgi:hypothetical protein|nr:hypothetical protein [Myxococcales bacterium]OQY67079.1 MAG: hypothetical protein B6D46_08220 [Polyangiaceae bacterium UTPRO1]
MVANDSLPSTMATVPGFDPARAGKSAECDGGGAIVGTRYAGREEFAGTLTGEYVDHGDPPWRWYLLKDLVRRPEGYPGDAVWCLAENLFVAGEPV